MRRPAPQQLLLVLFAVAGVTAQPDARELKKQHKKRADDALASPGQLRQEFRALRGDVPPGLFKKSLNDDQRLAIFQSNVREVSRVNSANLPYVLTINKFALADADELAAFLVMPQAPLQMSPVPAPPPSPPASIDDGSDGGSGSTDDSGRKLREVAPSSNQTSEALYRSVYRRQLRGNGNRRPVAPPSSPIRQVPPSSPIRRSPSPRPPSPAPRVLPRCAGFPCDWRNVSGQSYVAPTRDQGGCGSCSFFSARATWESMMMVRGQVTAPFVGGAATIASSTQYILNCASSMTAGQVWTIVDASGTTLNRCQWGGWPDESWAWLRANGQVREDVLGYSSGGGAVSACNGRLAAQWGPNIFSGPDAVIISAWSSTNVNNIAALKTALMDGPLSIVVWAAFGGYGGGVWTCSQQDSDTRFNHAMVLVGFTNVMGADGITREAWIVQNSWGSGWGVEGGYIYISTDVTQDCGVSQWWAARPTLAVGNAAPFPPQG